MHSYTVRFYWVPGHVGIRGNKIADMAAKNLVPLSSSITQVPYSDLFPCVQFAVCKLWQNQMEHKTLKLYGIKPVLADWPSSHRRSRKEEVVLARLRIGHCRMTHLHLLKGDSPPVCPWCDESLTVSHLFTCGYLKGHSLGCFNCPEVTLLEILSDASDVSAVISYLKHIGIY